MGDLYNAANLQQQMQGLQPIVDYGAAQRQLAETLLKQRMDEDARRSLLTWEYRQRLAAQAQQQQFERQQSEARNTFTAAENVKTLAGHKAIAEAGYQAYMDRQEKLDEMKRIDFYEKQKVFRKKGELIKDYFLRAENEIDDKQNAQIDKTAEQYAVMQNNLNKLTMEMEQDKQAALRKAGIRAVKNSGYLDSEQKRRLESGGKDSVSYEELLLSPTLKPDKRSNIEDSFQQGIDAAKSVYAWPVDKRVQEQQLVDHISKIEKFIVPGLLKKGEDYSRFYDKTIGAGGQPIDYNRTVQSQINPIASLQERTNGNAAAQKVVRPGVIGAGATGSFGPQPVEGLFPALGRIGSEAIGDVGTAAKIVTQPATSLAAPALQNVGTALFGNPQGWAPIAPRGFMDAYTPEDRARLENSMLGAGTEAGGITFDSRTPPSVGFGNLRSAEQEDFNRRFMLLPNGKAVPRLPTDIFGSHLFEGDLSRQQIDAAARYFAPPSPITAAPPIVQSAPPGYFPAQPVPEFNPYIPLIPYR